MALEGLRIGGGVLCLCRSGATEVEAGIEDAEEEGKAKEEEEDKDEEVEEESSEGSRLFGPLARRLLGCTRGLPRFSRLPLSMV